MFKHSDLIMIQVQHLQTDQLAHMGIDGSNPTIHKLQMRVELVQEGPIANKFGHAISEEQIVKLFIILAPCRD